jgi:hypothetical protein
MARMIYFAATILIRSVERNFFLNYGDADMLVKPSQPD